MSFMAVSHLNLRAKWVHTLAIRLKWLAAVSRVRFASPYYEAVPMKLTSEMACNHFHLRAWRVCPSVVRLK